jgi:hypothetical protein
MPNIDDRNKRNSISMTDKPIVPVAECNEITVASDSVSNNGTTSAHQQQKSPQQVSSTSSSTSTMDTTTKQRQRQIRRVHKKPIRIKMVKKSKIKKDNDEPKVFFGVFWEIEKVLDYREREIIERHKSSSRSSKKTTKGIKRKVAEYLIKWKGSNYPNSWEPEENLCDTALADALSMREAKTSMVNKKVSSITKDDNDDDQLMTMLDQKKRCSNTRHSNDNNANDNDYDDDLVDLTDDISLGGISILTSDMAIEDDDYMQGAKRKAVTGNKAFAHQSESDHSAGKCKQNKSNYSVSNKIGTTQRKDPPTTSSSTDVVEDTNFDWSANGMIHTMDIQRMSVLDPTCSAQLKASRLMGIPIILVDHKGFPQFASRWLSLTDDPESKKQRYQSSISSYDESVVTITTCFTTPTATTVSNTFDKSFQKPQNSSINNMNNFFDLLDESDEESKNGIIDCVSNSDNYDIISIKSETDTNTNKNDKNVDIQHSKDDVNVGMNNNPTTACTATTTKNVDDSAIVINDDTLIKENDLNNNPKTDKTTTATSVADMDSKNVDDRDVLMNDDKLINEPLNVVMRKDHNVDSDESQWLDLTLPYVVDVMKMINDIGDEMVPILRKKYNEENPIKGHISVRRFLRDCWPNENQNVFGRKGPLLYLHQWLFTASDTAATKLCNGVNMLPLNLLADDLLRHWYNIERCYGDSPYQYIFMGDTDTFSRLHKDNGGLEIFIAPIVGQKEVKLVHRSDGATSLYHLDANVDEPNFVKYPMLYSARVWQSVIKPGEILIIPQGTYHQCRNITPCLSYHRFHLDSLNLKAFYESWKDKDAPDIDHEEVIWNAATELCLKVDTFVYDLRRNSEPSAEKNNNIPLDVHCSVDSLRIIHKICLEMSAQLYADDKVKDWKLLVQDVETTLHDFRYRLCDEIPTLKLSTNRKHSPRLEMKMR